jgi:hypothetical protein
MKRHDFGKRSGIKVPPANIGGMRLPADVDKAVALVRQAIDAGMRYIDTSRGYGESEWVIGRALKDGYRKKVVLSTKWSPWVVKIDPSDDTSSDCMRRRLEESMRRLDVDHLDFYQIWNIDSREHYDQAVRKGGMLDGILKAMNEGLVKHTGFTTHDSVQNLLGYIPEADWCEIMLLTYNMLNSQYAPVIEAAHAKGIGTVIMNPVGGGGLAENSPVLAALARAVGAASIPDMAIRYVLSNPGVDCVISGLSKPSDVTDTVASAEAPRFSAEQVKAIDDGIARIRGEAKSFCTACRYCMPCPAGIDIPAVMSCIHDARYWGWENRARDRYRGMNTKADACTQCRQCEAKCTQHLKIVDEMMFANRALVTV